MCTQQIAFLLSAVFVSTVAYTQSIARFTADAGAYKRTNTPVSITFEHIPMNNDTTYYLEETTPGRKGVLPCQIENGYHRTMWWILSGTTNAGEKRTFELKYGSIPASSEKITATDNAGTLTMAYSARNIMQYNYKTVYPPAGVDTAFRRSGFIHPLWSPKGTVLTNIQPSDHYHHYGIWNPWTHTTFEGKEVDFWNLVKREGRVCANGFLSTTEGPVYGGFKAHHIHVAHPDSIGKKTALNEVWDVRVFNQGTNVWLWELTSTLSCASESPLTIEEYRYQGLGFRANAEWTKENAAFLTSEGKTRKDADNTRARWCMVEGQSTAGRSGIVFLGNPSNYNYPEPIRIWDEKQNNGRGDVFFNFCPTKTQRWQLVPGHEYTLRYRMLVYDNACTKEQAEAAWIDFANPPFVTIDTTNK